MQESILRDAPVRVPEQETPDKSMPMVTAQAAAEGAQTEATP